MKAHKRFWLLNQEIEEDDAVDLFWGDKEDLEGESEEVQDLFIFHKINYFFGI